MRQASGLEAVAVTGIGPILPGSDSVESLWGNLFHATSNLTLVPMQDQEGILQMRIGAPIEGFTYEKYIPTLSPRFASKYSRGILMALSAVQLAVDNAKLDLPENGSEANRVGVIGSSARGPLEWWTQNLKDVDQNRLIKQGVLSSLPGSVASLAAIHFGAKGFVSTISNACVGGHQAVGLAARLIAVGDADVMIVIGYETPLISQLYDIYTAEGSSVLSRDLNSPKKSIKPYDIERDGFALGEGAIALTLESGTHAKQRGAYVYSWIRNTLTINEASHAMRMDLSGQATADLILNLANQSKIRLESVDYICGHGTGTRYNDVAESRAVQIAFKHRMTLPPLGSVKPIFGHLLGAAGVLNCGALALMLDKQYLVPTANCIDVDPECDLDHVQYEPRKTHIRTGISLSFAIGSQSSAILLEAA